MTGATVEPERFTVNEDTKRSWWARRTILEFGLFILVLVLVIIVVALVIVVASNSTTQSKSKQHSPVSDGPTKCLTQDCVVTAAEMLEAMNTSVDPCDDFYEYACGKWNVRNVRPSYALSYSKFAIVKNGVDVKVKDLLESPVDAKEPNSITKAKTMYKSCMNTTLINQRGNSPLLAVLSGLGGWPVIDHTWDESKYDLNELVAKVNMLGKAAMWICAVTGDVRNSDSNIIVFAQPALGLPSRDYFLDPRYTNVLENYKKQAIRTAMAFDNPPNRLLVVRDIVAMVDFEISLANITVPAELMRNIDAVYHKYTVDDLTDKVTNAIDWRRYLNLQFNEVNVTIDGSKDVIVYQPEFFKQLATLLENTPNRTVANYIIWTFVSDSTSVGAFLDINLRYQQALSGVTTASPRWKTCVSTTKDLFEMEVGRMFVEKYFDMTTKRMAGEMIKHLKEALIAMLAEETWMDDSTRNLAIAKANAISEMIGYPEEIMDDNYLDLQYKQLHLQEGTFYENIVNIWKIDIKNNLKKINERVDRNEWVRGSGPTKTNAFYDPGKNNIVIPAAFLQPPIYSETYPKSVSFGGIGFVVGHELTHGFDDLGRQFDINGNAKQWWSKEVIEKFNQRAQCIVNQYSSYTVSEVGMNVNGKLTLGENIADNGGLKESFLAYRNWVSRQGREEDVLPGLNLDNNQLFFLSFAQMWCEESLPLYYTYLLKSDPHSPFRFRVIGTLSNSKEFAHAYKCPAGSEMNPVKKCDVW